MEDENPFTQEQIDAMVKEQKNVFDLRDRLGEILNNQPSNDCFLAMRMMLISFLCDSCVSKDAAVEMLASFSSSSLMILNEMDQMGFCAWNRNDQTLQ